MIKQLALFLSKSNITRKIGSRILDINQFIWERLPESVLQTSVARSYGVLLHKVVQVRDTRQQSPWTYFLRNRAEMDLVHEIVDRKKVGAHVSILVLACSIGMEVYTVQWRLQDLKQKVNIRLHGMEIQEESLDMAKKGEYPLPQYEKHLERLTDKERDEFFSIENGLACVHPWLKENIEWSVGDACDPNLVDKLGEQDIVIANRFLCHMYSKDAENCLNNITRLVAVNGYLFVTGIDLEVRQKVMQRADFLPVPDHLAEIHNGDSPLIKEGWPWTYYGLEPISSNPDKDDYLSRYAMVYQRIGNTSGTKKSIKAREPENLSVA
jgi:chemotaxis methyl-accepting protein methylase